MRSIWMRVLMIVAVLWLGGCAAPGEDSSEAVKSSAEPMINGVDNRLQYGAHPDPSLRSLARYSSAAMLAASDMTVPASGPVTFSAPTLQQTQNLCDGQRFGTEQAPARCTATLIDDDLVLTSTVCFAAFNCANTRFVFNYFRASDTSPNPVVTADDVYSCQSIVVQQSTPADFAIVRLDRPATPKQSVAPVRINRAALAQGLPVAAIGYSGGTAVKIDSGAIVLGPSGTSGTKFVTNGDAFYGNPGSGVYYTETYELAGLISSVAPLVPSYVPGPSGSTPAGCNVVQVCPETGCSADTVTATYVGPALDAYCAANTNPRLCQAQDRFTYSASNGIGVRRQAVFLEQGATINLGTCSVFGASATGDTTLQLVAPDGMVVASNDDFCGTASWTTYTVPMTQGGRYQIVAGCFSTSSCSGTVAYEVRGKRAGSYSFAETNTNYAQNVSRDIAFSLYQGETITVGTCGMENTSFTGDTFLRLASDPFNPADATVVASNDDACGGVGSQLSYTASSDQGVRLHVGCFQNTACSGTMSYTIGVRGIPFSATNTASAQQNTINQTVHLLNGGQITVGTCGMPGAASTGDTFIRLFSGTTQVAANDDACGGSGSRLTYRTAVTGDFSLRLGCYGTAACNGTAVFRTFLDNSETDNFSFSTTNTASATQATINKAFFLHAGDILTTSTCPTVNPAAGSATGDTFLRLFGPNGLQVAQSDDNCSGSPALSTIGGFVVPPEAAGAYELRAGCFSNGACSGKVGYAIP